MKDRYTTVEFMERAFMPSLTEPGEHGELSQVVGHGAHEPVCVCLPHGIEETVKDHEPYVRGVFFTVDIDVYCQGYALACVRSSREVMVKQDDVLGVHEHHCALTFGRSKPRYV